MDVSETIVAAGIGGAATVTAALFQLYTAMRVKSGQTPKKTSLLRVSVTTTALMMVASAAGGYLYAELRQQQALDDARAMHDELRTMRDEINAQLLVLAQTTGRLVQDRRADGDAHDDAGLPSLASRPGESGCDESSGDATTPCVATEPPQTSVEAPADGVGL